MWILRKVQVSMTSLLSCFSFFADSSLGESLLCWFRLQLTCPSSVTYAVCDEYLLNPIKNLRGISIIFSKWTMALTTTLALLPLHLSYSQENTRSALPLDAAALYRRSLPSRGSLLGVGSTSMIPSYAMSLFMSIRQTLSTRLTEA